MTEAKFRQWLDDAGIITGENMVTTTGQLYRSLGTSRNVFEADLQKFARAIRAATIEECAAVCEKREIVLGAHRDLLPAGSSADYFCGGVASASRRCASAIRSIDAPMEGKAG